MYAYVEVNGMDGYMQRTEKKKKAIRHAALELFSAYGIEKVSLAEIAKTAHVSPVTIYNYFGTKDELIKKVMYFFLEDEWHKQIELIKSSLSFPEKIQKMLFDEVEWTNKWNKEILDQLLSNDPEWRAMVEVIFNEALPEIMRFIESGKEEGYIDKDLSTSTVLVYFNLLKELKFTSLFKEVSADTQMLEELSRLFIHGLLNQK